MWIFTLSPNIDPIGWMQTEVNQGDGIVAVCRQQVERNVKKKEKQVERIGMLAFGALARLWKKFACGLDSILSTGIVCEAKMYREAARTFVHM